MLYRLNGNENREARSGPELPQSFPNTSKTENLPSARSDLFFSFGSVNRKINRSTRVTVGHYASLWPDKSKQMKFRGGSPVQVQDRHLKAALSSIPRCRMPAWSISFKGGQQHCEPTDEQPQHREHVKNCQCFPEPLKHNREAAKSYVGTRKLSKTFKLLFFWELTQIWLFL